MTAIALRKKMHGSDIDSPVRNSVMPYPESRTGQGLCEPALLVIQKFLDAQTAIWKSIFEYTPVEKKPETDHVLANFRATILGTSNLAQDPKIMEAARAAVRRMENDEPIDFDKWSAEISGEFAKYKD